MPWARACLHVWWAWIQYLHAIHNILRTQLRFKGRNRLGTMRCSTRCMINHFHSKELPMRMHWCQCECIGGVKWRMNIITPHSPVPVRARGVTQLLMQFQVSTFHARILVRLCYLDWRRQIGGFVSSDFTTLKALCTGSIISLKGVFDADTPKLFLNQYPSLIQCHSFKPRSYWLKNDSA